MARLEALATWTESLRDTIAGAVGLEQAIPASLRAAAPSLRDPLARLVDRLHTRVPMPDALRRFADDLDDPGADLIIAALIINARLRGPGLRDLLGALSASVREELDMRRKVNAERRSTRRSAQIVVGVSVGLALGLAVFNHSYVHTYDSPLGQLVLVVVVAHVRGRLHLDARAGQVRDAGAAAAPVPPVPAGPARTAAARPGRCVMTAALLAGALAGARPVPVRARAAARGGPAWPGRWPRSTRPHRPPPPAGAGQRDGRVSRRLGRVLARVLRGAGLGVPVAAGQPVPRSASRSRTSWPPRCCWACSGSCSARSCCSWLGLAGVRLPVVIPIWLGLALGGVFFFLPDLEVRQKADARRRDFRHAIGAFLDLVSMNLSGGRGVPEALMAASEIGSGWALWRIGTRWPTPGSPARRRGRRSARWARRSGSTSCATWPPR